MRRPELREREHLGVPWVQHGAHHVPHHGLATDLLPQALGRAVVHDQVAVAQRARNAELEHLALDHTLVGQRRVAERTERHYEGYPTHDIVDHLMPGQNLERIRARVAIHLHHNHGSLVAVEIGHLGQALELRLVDRLNAVSGRPPGDELVHVDQADLPVRPPQGERSVDAGTELRADDRLARRRDRGARIEKGGARGLGDIRPGLLGYGCGFVGGLGGRRVVEAQRGNRVVAPAAGGRD